MKRNCMICQRLLDWEKDKNPYFIHEFKNSIFVLGDHQYFSGYSLILFKRHVRELHELSKKVQQGLFQELMIAGKTIFKTFTPWKMNYSCYGNVVEHIHWHIFPRYKSDPYHKKNPWFKSSEFENYAINEKQRQDIIIKIRRNI